MVDDGNLLTLTNLGPILDHPEAVAWGPDGRIYAGGEDGQLYRLGLEDRSCEQVARVAGGFILGLAHDAAGNVTSYGNLYGNLLDYVISAALIFYILTIAGIFRLRQTRPNAERPYKAFGYPIIPILYIVGAAVILIVLFVYQTATTWPGLIIVLTGIPVYFVWRKLGVPMDAPAGRLAEDEV